MTTKVGDKMYTWSPYKRAHVKWEGHLSGIPTCARGAKEYKTRKTRAVCNNATTRGAEIVLSEIATWR